MSLTTPAIYKELDITRVINAFEVVTLYGGSIMRPEVRAAMAGAAEGYYHIPSLNKAISQKIARMTGNEAAFITSGTSASLALAAAACMAGDSRILREALPFSQNSPNKNATSKDQSSILKDEIIVFRCQRNPYDRALRMSGCTLVEIGFPSHKAERHQIEDAITDKTAAIFYFAGALFERYALSIEDTATIAKEHRIPLIVDGAAQIPPKENLWRYTQRGATIALFSGGKGIRGPQDTGLIVGDPVLIKNIESIAAPYQAFGRPMKTSKEAMVGLLKAIELILAEDYEDHFISMKKELIALMAKIDEPAIEKSYIIEFGRHGQHYPRAVFVLRDKKSGERERFIQGLLEGTPPVLVGPLDEDDSAFYVNPFGFQSEDEYKIVEQRIREECRRHV
ncbi:MAG: hypothetical protein ACYDHW_15820 [Syntrophorhabdaceae bacterium]